MARIDSIELDFLFPLYRTGALCAKEFSYTCCRNFNLNMFTFYLSQIPNRLLKIKILWIKREALLINIQSNHICSAFLAQ